MTGRADTFSWASSSSDAATADRSERKCRGLARRGWKPAEVVAIVAGFVVFWPVGLGLLMWKIWQGRLPYISDINSFSDLKHAWGQAGARARTGNSAFEEYRAAELRRLEEERRRLVEEERAFAEYMERLKRARDQEEFDRFMAERHGRSGA